MTEDTRERRFATATEVAEYLRISRRTFKRHVAPHLPGIQIGARTIYDMEEVDGWAEAQKSGGTETQRPDTRRQGPRGRDTRSESLREITERLKSRM